MAIGAETKISILLAAVELCYTAAPYRPAQAADEENKQFFAAVHESGCGT
jgi:hypothetical protein